MQELLVAVIIAAVLIWLGLRLFRACRADPCKGCPGCGTDHLSAEQPTPAANPKQDNCG
jgi:hypothetical protein